MPLEAVAIHSFAAPIMRETKHDNDLRDRIAKLYAAQDVQKGSIDSNVDNASASQKIMTIFESAFNRGDLMYVGIFNDKPIVTVGCFDDGQTDTKRLQYLAVHPENVNRGIEARFIKQVYDAEIKKGVRQFMPVDESIHRIMTEYELIRTKD